MKQITRKIGRNKGKPRLWIEGAALIDAGLEHGRAWVLVPVIGGFDLARVDATPGEMLDGRRVRKIAGNVSRPVIDIAGASLAPLSLFGEMPDTVTLTYTPGAGHVTVRRTADVQKVAA